MTFIPNDEMGIGQRVKSTCDIRTFLGKFTKGHEFTIVGIGERGLDVKDDENHVISECAWTKFTPIKEGED